MAKVHWIPKENQTSGVTVPGGPPNVDFMVKDSKRFADSGGWGYAVFDYNAASDTFTPGTTAGSPPQGNDAKCGFACHTRAKARDYVFTQVREALMADRNYFRSTATILRSRSRSSSASCALAETLGL